MLVKCSQERASLGCIGVTLVSLVAACNSSQSTKEPSPAKLEHSSQVSAITAADEPQEAKAPRMLEPGVFFREIVIKRPTGQMRVWIYSPSEQVAAAIGCIVVPPAGSNLLTGMSLGEGDRAEHIPYVKAGYVVVSFDIDGPMPDSDDELKFINSIVAFRNSHAGVQNAQAALSVGLREIPMIDLKRVYTAGHSSAGTLALLFAATDPRIRGVAAYAPVTDILPRFPEEVLVGFEELSPGINEFLRASSPMSQVKILAKKPVFLFHALDDEGVSPQETKKLFDQMTSADQVSIRVLVDTGGHYNSMIEEGVPTAITWFNKLGQRE